MSDLKNRLRETLNELHAELENVEEVDPEMRGMLLGAAQEIDEKIQPTETDATDSPAAEDQPLDDRLADAARHFEVTHPTLSGIISRLANGLSQLGI